MHGIPAWFGILLHPAFWVALGVGITVVLALILRALIRRAAKKGDTHE